MPWYWALLFISFGLLSLLTLSPIPLLVAAGLWALVQPVEQPLRDEIEAAGLNPDLPPQPTRGMGCLTFGLWVVVAVVGALMVVGLFLLVLEEWGI